MRLGRRLLLEGALPDWRVMIEPGVMLDPPALFDARPTEYWLEIGFGGGEHLEAQALAHAQVGLIGVEPYMGGVARLVGACERHQLANVRIIVDDARLVLAALPERSLTRVYVLFPDPWPKVRHHKRRIVSPDTLAQIVRVLKPDGLLQLATDDPGYQDWMLAHLLREPGLEWMAERAVDWRERPEGWVRTRYEEKALAAGRPPLYLSARRKLT